MGTFPTQLRRFRIARGLSQAELGDLVGRRSHQIHRYEKGKSEPQGDVLLKIAKVLEVDPFELAGVDA